MTNYDNYNREERAICAHLFRLLHEKLELKEKSPIGQFLNKLALQNHNINLTNLRYDNIGIFCEVAIIRDAFQNFKPSVNRFMDDLTKLIMQQEKIQECRLYSQLPEVLSNPKLTHPKQIREKAKSEGIQLTQNESQVFGAIQGMFNAKPDLVITIDNKLLVIEAKFTEAFDEVQLKRTENIASVWAKLLYNDFGFKVEPEFFIIKLGAMKFEPHINWTDILQIAQKTYGENDRSLIALKNGVELLKHYKLE